VPAVDEGLKLTPLVRQRHKVDTNGYRIEIFQLKRDIKFVNERPVSTRLKGTVIPEGNRFRVIIEVPGLQQLADQGDIQWFKILRYDTDAGQILIVRVKRPPLLQYAKNYQNLETGEFTATFYEERIKTKENVFEHSHLYSFSAGKLWFFVSKEIVD